MLITDPEKLKAYASGKRLWQGIPAIERTRGGRLLVALYSGGTREMLGNYAVIIKSDDDGQTFSEPIAAMYKSEIYRCYDQCLWIDPLGRLWVIWNVAPDRAVYAAICENPDADTLVFGAEFRIGEEVMLNKPTVLSTGEWLFPIAVWHPMIPAAGGFSVPTTPEESGPYVYRTVDEGKTFQRLGCPFVSARSFDEHMVVELKNNTLMMCTRTTYGISRAYSYDGGRTWTVAENAFAGPCSRFYIGRLRSGRLLLINHVNFTGRSHLTAQLSDDDGKTWNAGLLLDERCDVSYPDVTQAPDGSIYVVYDRERGGFRESYAAARADAREILLAKITEADIDNAALTAPGSYLKRIVSKLGDYDGDADALYGEKLQQYNPADLRELLDTAPDADHLLERIFELYPVNCVNVQGVDMQRLNRCIEKLYEETADRKAALTEIANILNTVKTASPRKPEWLTQRVMQYLDVHFAENMPLAAVADACGVNVYYMCHEFKKSTGISVLQYRDARRMATAKKLLFETGQSVRTIGAACGYDDFNYFSRKFRQEAGLSPQKYRAATQKGENR